MTTEYAIKRSEDFEINVEDSLVWLYLHNSEQSQDFAEQKSLELRQEIKDLEQHLAQTPYMGQADEISGLRRFPLYGGRFVAIWTIDEHAHIVMLVEFIDSKYPQKLREYKIDE